VTGSSPAMATRPATLRELFVQEIPRLFAFAYHVSGDRAEALAHVRQMVRDATTRGESALLAQEKPQDALLAMMARRMENDLGRKAGRSFEELDQILRSDITRPISLHAREVSQDPEFVHVMLWQLKRTCLTATLACLPPGVRLSFVLTDLLGYSPAEAADLLDIRESAYRVRLTRARKRIEDYLTPRCYHVDRENPCTCTGRLGIALDAKFIDKPEHTLDIPHEPHDADGPRRDIASLYRALPVVKLSDADLRHLSSGEDLGMPS
jgi:DNA-directed RNA polymerase specialized sigma24 family protein